MRLSTRFTLLLLVWALLPLARCPGGEPPARDFELFMHGKYVYERNCIVCHGARGDGKGELAATLQPRPRSFREGMFKFRSTPSGALPTEADLARTIRGGLSGTAMGMFTQLGDDEVRAVIAFLQSFSSRWRKEEHPAGPMPLPLVPGWISDAKERSPHVTAGRTLFTTHCASCHGEQADGNGPAGAALIDRWSLPVKPSDLRQPHLRCGDGPADLYRVLATGLNGTPMVSFDATLSPVERWDIVAYVLSVRLPDVPNLGAAPAGRLQLQKER